jgi:hypothetical protein
VFTTNSLIAHATKIPGYLEERLKGKLMMYLEMKILDLEEGRELGMEFGY